MENLTPTKTTGKKIGRPRIQIDWDQFDKLCAMQCTLLEIASWFDCSDDTIENAVKREKDVRFSEYFAQKRGKGKISLRRKQFEVAMAGNVTMLIWLGKQYMDQSDKQQFGGNFNEDIRYKVTIIDDLP